MTVLSPDDAAAQILADQFDWLQRARSRPQVILYDKNWENSVPILGESAARWLNKLNDTGEGSLVLFGTHTERDWIVDELGEWEDLHIRVITGLTEWTGKADQIIDESDEVGFEHITVKFLHEFEHAKKIVCFANPWLPAEFQWPKIWAYAGPSGFGVVVLAFLNLMRRFGLPWTFSDNIFDPATWASNLNPETWPIVVVPRNVLLDTSMWCVLATRFGNFFDVVAPTLADAGLQLKVFRWFPGMAQPAPEFYTLVKPTLVIDVVDQSGYVGPSGTLADGLLSFATEVAGDLINQVATEINPADPPEWDVAGWFGTTRNDPWVCWRNAMRTGGVSGVKSWKMVRHKATASSIVTGGHSPDWVNAGMKLLLNAALGYLGQLIGNPALGLGIFEEQVEDVVLAFHRIPNPMRISEMGVRGPAFGEYWESSGAKGFSLSAIQAIRTGFHRTRAYTSFEVSAQVGKPYWPGAHFDLGDRVSAEIGRSNKLYVERVNSLAWEWDRDKNLTYEVVIGDGGTQDEPGAMFSRQLAMVKDVVQSLGVSS
ncbi:MAG: hypothetical protein QM658_09645 [Gordonia sp. (in: high G+C Gram-positive bacteria)]